MPAAARPPHQPPAETPAPVAATVSNGAALAPAQQLRSAVGAVQRIVDSVGDTLANTAVTPLTDLLSGALWLVRRAILPLGVGLGSPTACGLACTALRHSPAAPSRVLIVTSRVDGEAGSLRDVLGQAGSGDVIRFAPRLRGATLTLTQGALDVNVSVAIEGTRQALDADGLSRIMVVDEPGTTISLSGLHFTNGNAPGNPVRGTAGGAILADSVTLEISRSRFSGNSASATQAAEGESGYMQFGLGGAIAAFGSTVTVSDSDFIGNRATGADNDDRQQPSAGLGGAIFVEESAVTLQHSRFSANSATGGAGANPIEAFPTAGGGLGSGGAVFVSRGPLSATDVTFQHNTATGGAGLAGTESNPYGNLVGGGGNASGGALWVVGEGRNNGDPVHLELTRVTFTSNTATGGTAGAQGLASLGAEQGGRASGGGFGVVDWVAVSLAGVSVRDNLAQGGGAGANAPGAGENTGAGGVGQGGGAAFISPASVQATGLSVRDNTARGGKGADSAAVAGTEAGEGGYAYSGGVLMNNATGGLDVPAAVIPVVIRQAEIVGNRAVGGEPGSGPVPADGLGAGGLASAGGMEFTSVFDSRLVGVRFIGNSALAAQGKFAEAGALINPFGLPPEGETASLQIQNSLFRGNTAVGGDDAANPIYRSTRAGAFYNNGVGTVVSGSRFVRNSAVGGNDTGSGHLGSALGGAIYSEGVEQTSTTIFNTSFANNSAVGGRRLVAGESIVEPRSGEARGGALYAFTGTTTINGGAFVRNSATVRTRAERAAAGGAIEISFAEGDYTNYLTTTGVRFVSNAASSRRGVAGGGAISFNGTALVDNGSTFYRNQARSGRGEGSAYGGALILEKSTQLNETTVIRNVARADQGFGGGIALPLGPEVLTAMLTAIGRNRASTAGDDLWWPTA